MHKDTKKVVDIYEKSGMITTESILMSRSDGKRKR